MSTATLMPPGLPYLGDIDCPPPAEPVMPFDEVARTLEWWDVLPTAEQWQAMNAPPVCEGCGGREYIEGYGSTIVACPVCQQPHGWEVD